MRYLKTGLAIIFTIIGISILIWFCIRGYYYEKFIIPNGEISLKDAALAGDFIGGFVGAIISFVGVFLLYETLSLQRNEFSESRNVFLKQQFDNTFFELLRLYQSITDKIHNTTIFEESQVYGKEFFKYEVNNLQQNFKYGKVLSYNRKNAVYYYKTFYVNYSNFLAPYFRTLYRIFDAIENSDIDEYSKSQYSKIVRAQLSESELILLRYNAMTEEGEKFKYYINDYNILKHLPHFELLEFKYWWSKVSTVERLGFNSLLKIIKKQLKEIIFDNTIIEIPKIYQNGRYKITTFSENEYSYKIIIERDINKKSKIPDIVDGLNKFTDQEIENLLECIVKELIISSNFNLYNNRRHVEFDSKTELIDSISKISAGVSNIKQESLNILNK